MSNKTEFERQLMALDRNTLHQFLDDTIGLYLEYVNVHGRTQQSARLSAILDMIDGSAIKIELDDNGEL